MNSCSWIILGCVVVLGLVVLGFLFIPQLKKKSTVDVVKANYPRVCSVWDRWMMLMEDEHVNVNKKFGNAWDGSICPKGNLLQTFNRTDAACIKPSERQESTTQICRNFISNDETATAAPAVCGPEEICASTDHWVFINEPIRIESKKKKGNAWDVDICKSGAALQVLGDETWCVMPEEIKNKTF